jgi:hypothetical protein
MRFAGRLALAALVAAASVSSAWAQAPTPKAAAAPLPASAPDRFRLVLNGTAWPATTSFSDSRTLTEYAEPGTIDARYEAGPAYGPEVAVQASLFRGVGLLVGYSYVRRDVPPGTVRIHPRWSPGLGALAGMMGAGLFLAFRLSTVPRGCVRASPCR